MKTRTIETPDEARQLSALLESSAHKTRGSIQEVLDGDHSALAALSRLKFEPVGCDPLDAERPLNLIEQLNQTFTYQVSFEAAAWLLDRHPDHAPLKLNLGTAGGTDIHSEDKQVAAEVFATVDPRNNEKLKKDITRMRGHTARFRYVVYLSPVRIGGSDDFEADGVYVHRLSLPRVEGETRTTASDERRRGQGSPLNESAIVAEIARQAARRVTHQVIAELQRMRSALLSGDDSGLRSTWDEVCVQVQYEHSFFWDDYDTTVRQVVAACFEQLAQHERGALWLQTEEGMLGADAERLTRKGDGNPVDSAVVVDYLTTGHVYPAASDWSNVQIRAYIEQSSRRD